MADKLDGFAERLKELCKQQNPSQTELGQLAGLHHTHIGLDQTAANVVGQPS